MKLAIHQGPVHAPALFAPHRRPIGLGARHVVVTDPAAVSHPRRKRPPSRKKSMKRTTFFVTLLLAVTGSATAVGIGAAVDTPRTLMSRDDYREALRGIQSATRESLGQCRNVEAMQRDLCKARVRADERVKRAELQARYFGTVAAAEDVQVARVKARYDVARAECGARRADQRTQCLREAREARSREIHSKVASST
jgi:hypothetical protein